MKNGRKLEEHWTVLDIKTLWARRILIVPFFVFSLCCILACSFLEGLCDTYSYMKEEATVLFHDGFLRAWKDED